MLKWHKSEAGNLVSHDGRFMIRKGPTTRTKYPWTLVSLTDAYIRCTSGNWSHVVCKTLKEAKAVADRQPVPKPTTGP